MSEGEFEREDEGMSMLPPFQMPAGVMSSEPSVVQDSLRKKLTRVSS